MKIRERSFPYPVLSENDDVDAAFQAPIEVRKIGEVFEIGILCQMSSDDLQTKIDRGDAAYGLHVESTRSFFREIYPFKPKNGRGKVELEQDNLRGPVDLNVVIYATKELPKYRITGSHEDYGNRSFYVAGGDFLGITEGNMVRLQRLLGCRPDEVCSLRPCDLDRTEEVWTYKPASHKTEHHGRERVIYVGPQAQGILLRYLARDHEAFCFRPCDSEEKRRAAASRARKTPLSCGNRPGTNRKRSQKRKAGERYDTNSYRRAIHRACDKAGIGRWSPNRLRHSAGTEIRKHFGAEGSQVILGHAHLSTTEIYAEKNKELGARIAAELG